MCMHGHECMCMGVLVDKDVGDVGVGEEDDTKLGRFLRTRTW